MACPLQGPDFCQLLNHRFRIGLQRTRDKDIAVAKKPNQASHANLFGQQAEDSGIDYYPLYECAFEYSDAELLVYCNKIAGRTMVKKRNAFDYFILIKEGTYLDFYPEFKKNLDGLPHITISRKLDILNEDWHEYLII